MKSKYTIFVRVTFHNILDNLLDQYIKIMTLDLEDNNHWMNKPIDSSLPINKYFGIINDYMQFNANSKTPYMVAQVFQKYHHVVLASGIHVDAWN